MGRLGPAPRTSWDHPTRCQEIQSVDIECCWVLDMDYVGGVILGSRLGVSDRTEDNKGVFGWNLDTGDLEDIERVLRRSRRDEMFPQMGDCGAEYAL
jgi:hypothetical protein